MPELPDVEVFARNLHQLFAGKKLLRIKIVNGIKLKNTAAAFKKKLTGKTLEKIERSGKEMRLRFSGQQMVGIHLMLTGDLFVFEKKNMHPSTIAELYFTGGCSLALTDRMKNAYIILDPVDKRGVDALSRKLNFKYLKQALQGNTSIKKVLTDQDAIRGIGNGYSDEILWQTRISPYAVARAIPDHKIKELLSNIKKILKAAVRRIYKNFPGKMNDEVKIYLIIHTGKKEKSPTGHPILVDKKGMMKTYYTREQLLYK